jgi:hypothetical protein
MSITKIVLKMYESDYSSLDKITDQDLQEIAELYHVDLKFVTEKFEDLILYCGSKNKTYSNYKQALAKWVKDDSRKLGVRKTNVQQEWKIVDIPESVRASKMESIREILKK